MRQLLALEATGRQNGQVYCLTRRNANETTPLQRLHGTTHGHSNLAAVPPLKHSGGADLFLFVFEPDRYILVADQVVKYRVDARPLKGQVLTVGLHNTRR